MQKNNMSFLKNLTTVADARTARASSWDQSGRNKDYWLVNAGDTAVMADVEGPGCINHIWVTTFCREILGPSIQHPVLSGSVAPVTEMENAEGVNWEINDPDYYRKVLIRMTWDDFDGPSVLAPLGDFFCIGHSMPSSFSSIPFNVSSRPCEELTFGGTASMNCYFPMPFNKRAKIEVINENERPLGLFFHIDYELYHEETPDIAYFQAAWRRDMPCSGWGNDLCVNSPEVNSVPNFDGIDNVANGVAAMQIGGTYMINAAEEYNKDGHNIGVVPLPSPKGKDPVTVAGGQMMAVSSQSKDVDAAADFIFWCFGSDDTTYVTKWCTEAKFAYPARQSVIEENKELFQEGMKAIFTEFYDTARPEPQYSSEVTDIMGDTLQSVMFGGSSGADAAQLAQEQIEALN